MQKEIVYAPIPDFDQTTQYITQITPVDMGDFYFVGYEIRGIEQTDESVMDMFIQ